MQAFPSKTQADWEIFLRGLGGAPQCVVCDSDAYVKHIRQWLEINHGRPGVRRRAIVDTNGMPSLR